MTWWGTTALGLRGDREPSCFFCTCWDNRAGGEGVRETLSSNKGKALWLVRRLEGVLLCCVSCVQRRIDLDQELRATTMIPFQVQVLFMPIGSETWLLASGKQPCMPDMAVRSRFFLGTGVIDQREVRGGTVMDRNGACYSFRSSLRDTLSVHTGEVWQQATCDLWSPSCLLETTFPEISF